MLNLYHMTDSNTLESEKDKEKNQNSETQQSDTIDVREMGGLWRKLLLEFIPQKLEHQMWLKCFFKREL